MAWWFGGLATIGGFTGVGFSKFPLDEPFNFEGELGDNTVHTMVKAVEKALQQPNMTPRQLGRQFAMCGFRSLTVGTPEMVADVIEDWINIGDVDAMNFLCRSLSPTVQLVIFIQVQLIKITDMSNPGSFEDIVELLVPVLQERGIMWNDYAVPSGTMRENMRREPGIKTLPSNHPGAQFRYDILKEKYADERGDIVIDRMKKDAEANGEKVNGVNGHA